MRYNSSLPFENQVVMIVGGSKGIAKETAKQIAELGGSICLVARDKETLLQTAEEVKSRFVSSRQFVEVIAADAADYDLIQPKIEDFIQQHSVPDVLINAVGYAYPNYWENFELKDFIDNLHTNYYGQLVPTMILLPYFRERRSGHVSFISSMLGFMGLIGYGTYTPSKFALIGLAETLRHELKPENISVSILFPPDTATPGFKQENKTKPPETAILSETAKLYQPEVVAEKYIKGILNNKFYIIFGTGRWIWLLFRLFPRLVHAIMDHDLTKARKKIRQQSA
ncbi:MAG: SDR family oxidoreductase [Anaerolineales bacterium]|nr:SDR family oxidoreductase [Anaerolineales bacterium]